MPADAQPVRGSRNARAFGVKPARGTALPAVRAVPGLPSGRERL